MIAASSANDDVNTAKAALLRQMLQDGDIDEATYQKGLAKLGIDPNGSRSTTFGMSGQQVGAQTNVAGDFYDYRNLPVGASPDELQRAYLSRLIGQVRQLPLFGGDSSERRNDLQLSAVYTALMTQQSDLDEDGFALKGEAQARMRDPKQEARRQSALQVLNKERKLVLLGEPGGGKSTFINFVALCMAGELLKLADANLAVLRTPLPPEPDTENNKDKKPQPQPWQHGPLVPVRIVLRDLAARGLPAPGQPTNGDTLWRFIVAELGDTLGAYAEHLKQALLQGRGLILLDGLDEVPDALQRRAQVKQSLQDFADMFGRCRFLVTSRTYAYQRQDWKLDGFAQAVLSPFTPGQIARFVQGWYNHMAAIDRIPKPDAAGRTALLQSSLQRSERLGELAARPLLLTLMAQLHTERGGELPEKREELYAETVKLLMERWERYKISHKPDGSIEAIQPSLAEWLKVDSRDDLQKALNRLAYEAHRSQEKLIGTADIKQADLVDALMNAARNPEVNPNKLVEFVRDRAGLLAARGHGIYAFPHRTFQEYLAAWHLTDTGFPEQVSTLLKADPNRWREATLLAAAKAGRGTPSAVWDLVEELCPDQPPAAELPCNEGDAWGALLAALALWENGLLMGEASQRYTRRRERVQRWMRAIVERGLLPPVDRARAGEALALLGDDRDLEALISIPAGSFWMGDDDMDDTKPRHQVYLDGFKIGKYPVTNAQYAHFVRERQQAWDSSETERLERGNCPAAYLTWHGAVAYCAWLTERWRAERRIGQNAVARLPTEAEWERAARGPSMGSGEGQVWPWQGDWAENRANVSATGIGQSSAVGMFPLGASPEGCLDMAGNVWEWCSDLYAEDEYAKRAKRGQRVRNPSGPNDGSARVVRGGSFDGHHGRACCAVRDDGRPYRRWVNDGFRIVVSPIS